MAAERFDNDALFGDIRAKINGEWIRLDDVDARLAALSARVEGVIDGSVPIAGSGSGSGTTALAAPTGLTVTAVDGATTTFDIAFSASSPSTDVAGYRVTVAGTQVSEGLSLTRRITANSGDRIAVFAFAADGRTSSEAAATAPATTAPAPAPEPPTNVTATEVAGTPTSVDIAWTASPTADVTYRVYQDTTVLASVAASPARIDGLTAGQSVTYTVVAVGADDQESTAASVTYAAPEAPITNTGTTGQPTKVRVATEAAEPNTIKVFINGTTPQYVVSIDGTEVATVDAGYYQTNTLTEGVEVFVEVRGKSASNGRSDPTATYATPGVDSDGEANAGTPGSPGVSGGGTTGGEALTVTSFGPTVFAGTVTDAIIIGRTIDIVFNADPATLRTATVDANRDWSYTASSARTGTFVINTKTGEGATEEAVSYGPFDVAA